MSTALIERLTRVMIDSGAAWVLWLLFTLSFVSIAIALERLIAFRNTYADVDALVPALRKLLRANDQLGAARLLEQSDSVEGRVVAAGLAEAELGPEAAAAAMAAAAGLERKHLEKRLLVLGTVGNNAPFVGLLGTVIGVVGAFDALGKTQAVTSSLAPERVMGTIAEALVATAVGLMVAIPAVALFNYFQGRVAAALADGDTLGHVLLAHLRGQRGARLEKPTNASRSNAQHSERHAIDGAAE